MVTTCVRWLSWIQNLRPIHSILYADAASAARLRPERWRNDLAKAVLETLHEPHATPVVHPLTIEKPPRMRAGLKILLAPSTNTP